MRNWLGQDIEVGSVVGRGARQGNSSDFKLGVVIKLDEPNQKARVAWKYESHSVRKYVVTGQYPSGREYGEWEFWALVPHAVNTAGSPSLESLFLLDQSDLDRAGRMHDLVVERNNRNGTNMEMSKQEFIDRLAQL